MTAEVPAVLAAFIGCVALQEWKRRNIDDNLVLLKCAKASTSVDGSAWYYSGIVLDKLSALISAPAAKPLGFVVNVFRENLESKYCCPW